MLKDTVKKMESEIKKMSSVDTKKKKELVSLLSRLKSEVNDLSKTHREHAQSVAGFTEVAAHEATRKEKAPDLLKLSLDGLSSSVEGFEESHPKLVAAVNDFCTFLARIGI